MEGAKLGLEVLSTVLEAAPIPEPFKSAVTAIPDLALKIMEVVEVSHCLKHRAVKSDAEVHVVRV